MSRALPHPDLSVRCYREAHGPHVHRHYQVLWALEGELELELDGHLERLSAGQGLVLLPGQRHDSASRAGSRCLVLDTLDPAWAGKHRHGKRPQALHHLANYLALSLSDAPGASAQALAGVAPLLLAQAWGEAAGGPLRRPRRAIDWLALRGWVQARLHLPLDAAQLAAQVHLSESQFRERCVEALGIGPVQWLRALRLERARALRAAGTPVAEVARHCGYRSPSALTAALKARPAPPAATTPD